MTTTKMRCEECDDFYKTQHNAMQLRCSQLLERARAAEASLRDTGGTVLPWFVDKWRKVVHENPEWEIDDLYGSSEAADLAQRCLTWLVTAPARDIAAVMPESDLAAAEAADAWKVSDRGANHIQLTKDSHSVGWNLTVGRYSGKCTLSSDGVVSRSGHVRVSADADMIEAAIAWASSTEQQQIRTLEKCVSDLVMAEAEAMALVVSHEGKIETLQAQLAAARKVLATSPAAQRYAQLTFELLAARKRSGGELSPSQEEFWAGRLSDQWAKMTVTERNEADHSALVGITEKLRKTTTDRET